MSKTDLYSILGIAKDANQEQIKRAYRELAQKYHPDKNNGDKECEEKFKEINEAYSILSDPNKRSQYDSPGMSAGGDPFYSVDMDNIFNQFFSYSTTHNNSPMRGSDIVSQLKLTLSEAIFGCKKDLEINRKVKCIPCNGLGASEFQKCVACEGAGHIRRNNGPHNVVVHTCRACSGSGRMAKGMCGNCGSSGHVNKGGTVSVVVPPNVKNSDSLKLNGLGNEGRNGGPTGNFILSIYVKYPEPDKITEEQRKLLLDLDDISI